MAFGSIGGDFTLLQSYLSSGLSMNKYVSNLMEQKKTNSSYGSSYFDGSLSQKLGAVNSNAIELQSMIGRMASLTQYTSGIGKMASYSNEGVLSASVAMYAQVSNYTKTDVDVSQLASGQQNRSSNLYANENSFGEEFSISITDSEGKTRSFSVSLTEDDNNRTALKAMANEINASNTGVRATLVEDKENGTVNIQLTSQKTGDANGKFTVVDESAANLDNVYSVAQNAEYSVNGIAFSSQSNEVRIMDGVMATLNKTGATQLTYSTDSSQATGEVQKFLDTFNNLLDASSDSPLKQQLTTVMVNNIRGLGYSGIGVDTEGKFTIDDPDKLSESISNGSFARNFQGIQSFGHRLYDVTMNAYNTVYDAARQESVNDLISSIMKNFTQSPYGNWQGGASFNPGLIFSIWA